MRHIRYALPLLLWITFCLQAVSADLFFEFQTIRPGKDNPIVTESFYSETGIRLQQNKNTVHIVNFEDKVFYELDLEKKTYTSKKFEDFSSQSDLKTGASSGQQEGNTVNQMIESMHVEPTDEKEEINGFTCIKQKVTGMGAPSTYWVTPDIAEYQNHMDRIEKHQSVFSAHPFWKSVLTYPVQHKKIGGVLLKSITRMMSMDFTTVVSKFETKPIDESMFRPPKDFTLSETK